MGRPRKKPPINYIPEDESEVMSRIKAVKYHWEGFPDLISTIRTTSLNPKTTVEEKAALLDLLLPKMNDLVDSVHSLYTSEKNYDPNNTAALLLSRINRLEAEIKAGEPPFPDVPLTKEEAGYVMKCLLYAHTKGYHILLAVWELKKALSGQDRVLQEIVAKLEQEVSFYRDALDGAKLVIKNRGYS